VPHDATAFAHRDTLFYLQAYAFSFTRLSDTSMAFVEGMLDTITNAMPGVDFGAYAGYVECVVVSSFVNLIDWSV
jgi:hypothetical protein